MLSVSHFGRSVAAVLTLFSIAFLGTASAASSAAQPLNRQRSGKLAVAVQASLQARAGERDRLRQLARRACAAHRQALCARVNAQLTRSDPDARPARRSALRGRRKEHALKPPAAGTGPSASGNSPSPSGSSSNGLDSPSTGTETPLTSITNANPQESESSTSTTAGFEPGLNSGANMNLDVAGSAQLGAKLVRIAFLINETPAQMEAVIAGYAARGIRVLPLACFDGTLPSAGETQQLASWAQAYGPGGTYWASHPAISPEPIQAIEFGNETSYGYQYGDEPGDRSYQERAETYARRVEQASEAITATGIPVGVLAQADDWSGEWVNGMYAAVPDLGKYVAGWTIHPYGPNWKERVEDLVQQTAAHGAPSTIPIDITEWGLSTDNSDCVTENYGWNPCMSYQEAATTLSRNVSEMRQLLGGRLHIFCVYAVRDQAPAETSNNREAYFGALQQDLQPKGAYTTAVQTLLASS
jgi:hypothetical protein